MRFDIVSFMRSIHVLLGAGGFLLGFGALIVRKFGRRAWVHRWIGRAYAGCMLGSTALSLPLAWRTGDTFLLVIGILTFAWVVGGWLAIRQSHVARGNGRRERANTLLRTHLILMGSSYIAAWTAFLVNVMPLGSGSVFWLYAFGPTVLGTVLIARASRRYKRTERAHTIQPV